jgi:hypothetical protein
MTPQDSDFLFRRVVLPLLLHARAIILMGERFLHFQLNRNTPYAPRVGFHEIAGREITADHSQRSPRLYHVNLNVS